MAESLNVVIPPTQTVVIPEMGAGWAAIVFVEVMKQPVGRVKLMDAVPAQRPAVNVAVEPAADNIPSPVLLHVPPEEVSVSVMLSPAHSVLVPCMGRGFGLRVNMAVAKQPEVV